MYRYIYLIAGPATSKTVCEKIGRRYLKVRYITECGKDRLSPHSTIGVRDLPYCFHPRLHTLPHTHKHESLRYLGVLLSTRHIIVISLSFPVTLLSANGVHHDVFYCSPLVSTNTEDSTITLRKRQDWGLIIHKMRAISEAGEDKGGSDGRVRLRCIS